MPSGAKLLQFSKSRRFKRLDQGRCMRQFNVKSTFPAHVFYKQEQNL